MQKRKRVWIGLATLSGIVMAYPAVQGMFFFKGTLLLVEVSNGVRFLADKLFLLLFLFSIAGIGASLCLLSGTAAAAFGVYRIGSRAFMLGAIFQWLFLSAAVLLAKFGPAANYRRGLVIYCAVTIIVSVATLQLRRLLRVTPPRYCER